MSLEKCPKCGKYTFEEGTHHQCIAGDCGYKRLEPWLSLVKQTKEEMKILHDKYLHLDSLLVKLNEHEEMNIKEESC